MIKCNIKKNCIIYYFNILFTILYISWCLTPYLFRNSSKILVLLILLGWFITYIKSYGVEMRISFLCISVITWLWIVLLYALKQYPNFYIGNYIYILLFYLPLSFIFYIKDFSNKININLIKKFIYFIMIVNVISNIFILTKNPYAAKELTGNYGLISLSKTNIVEDIHIIAYLLFGYINLIMILSSNTVKRKVFSILSFTLCIIMIFKTTFFIAIITLLLECILILFVYGKASKEKSIKNLLFLFLIVIVFIFREPLVIRLKDTFLQFTDNYVVIERINSLSDLLIGNNMVSGSLEARFKDIFISFNTFLNNLILGKGFLVSTDLELTGIGMHSYFMDDLARFGITGMGIQIYIYIKAYFKISKLLNPKMKKYYSICWVGFIFYGMFNPLVYPATGLMIFFILPIFFMKEDEEKNEKNINDKYFADSLF